MELFDEETKHAISQGDNPLEFPGLKFTLTAEESKSLNENQIPSIIISASGMCEVGRIKHHLKHNLWQAQNTILFVGYQAYGTLGRSLIEGATSVKLFGETVTVAAQIKQLPGISGHADVDGLTTWISHIQNPKRVFVIHGESSVMEHFVTHLQNDLKLNAYAPYSGTEFDPVTNQILVEAVPKPIAKPKTSKANTVYHRLLAALERLTGLIKRSEGRTNKELARLTDQINELCNKFEK